MVKKLNLGTKISILKGNTLSTFVHRESDSHQIQDLARIAFDICGIFQKS